MYDIDGYDVAGYQYHTGYAHDDDSLRVQRHHHCRPFDTFHILDSRFQIIERIRRDAVPEDQPRPKQIRLQQSKRDLKFKD